jgi:rare lipoprotein A
MVARSIAISFCVLLGSLLLASLAFFPSATADEPVIEDLGQVSASLGPHKRAVKIVGETGVASIYGFEGDKTAGGTKTANGEDIRPTDMSAAHKSIPFGTRVRVTNLVNGLSAVVRINNRGPFTKGRIIDLTPTAAAALGFSTEQGIAPVTLMVLKD